MINTLAILTGNGLSILIVVIVLLNLPHGFSRGSASARMFTWLCVPIVLGALFGAIIAFFDGVPGTLSRIMVTLCGIIGIIMPVLMSFTFWLYVETTASGGKKLPFLTKLLASIPIDIIFVFIIINFFEPVLFYISPQNVYNRGPFGLIAYIFAPVYLIVSIFRIAYIKSKKRGFFFVPLIGVIAPILIVSAIQFLRYGVIQSWMGFAVGLLTLYIGMYKDLLYKDSMTGVFNRIYLEYILEDAKNAGVTLGGIMLDINHFKSINDEYGRREGDRTIVKAAKIIKNSVGDNENVIRVGGDEFLIVGEMDNDYDISVIINKIRDNCEAELSKKSTRVAVEFSIGGSVFEQNKMSESEWMSSMDEKMYKDKVTNYAKRGIDRRAGSGSPL